MFDEKTAALWRDIRPDGGLKARALSGEPARVRRLPARRLAKRLAPAAACAVIALAVLLRPVSPGLTLAGQSPDGGGVTVPQVRSLQPAPMQAAFPAAQQVSVPLELEREAELSVDGGMLLDARQAGTTITASGQVLWQVTGSGPFTLTLRRGGREFHYVLSLDENTGLWQLAPAENE